MPDYLFAKNSKKALTITLRKGLLYNRIKGGFLL